MTCTLDPVWLDGSAADALLAHALAEVPWRRDDITLFGRTHPIPRLHCWFADAGMTYRWSGITLHPAPWTPTILAIRARLEAELGRPFPFLLANLYRNGADSMGWHTDDEREMGGTPTIASVSVGAARDFLVREKATGHRTTWPLPHGSLLIMPGELQRTHEHSLPRRARVHGPRVNLSFRSRDPS